MEIPEIPQRSDVLCGLLVLMLSAASASLFVLYLYRLLLIDPRLAYMSTDPMLLRTLGLG